MALETPEDMLALRGRRLPENAKSYDELFRYWKESASHQTERTRDLTILRQRMRYALASESPSQFLSEQSGEQLVIGRAGRRDRIAAVWRPGKGSPLLFVHEQGTAPARKTQEVQTAWSSDRPVLLIDTFQTGTAVAVRDRSPRYFLTFNKSDDANRVQDILTALAWLRSTTGEKIEVRGTGSAGVWCLFAAAVAGVEITLKIDLGDFKGQDDDFLRRFFVPGIRRAGGLDAALRLTAAYRQN